MANNNNFNNIPKNDFIESDERRESIIGDNWATNVLESISSLNGTPEGSIHNDMETHNSNFKINDRTNSFKKGYNKPLPRRQESSVTNSKYGLDNSNHNNHMSMPESDISDIPINRSTKSMRYIPQNMNNSVQNQPILEQSNMNQSSIFDIDSVPFPENKAYSSSATGSGSGSGSSYSGQTLANNKDNDILMSNQINDIPYGTSYQYYNNENDIDLGDIKNVSKYSQSSKQAFNILNSNASSSDYLPPATIPITTKPVVNNNVHTGLPPQSFAVDPEVGLTGNNARRKGTLYRPERQRSTRRLMNHKPSDRFGEWYTKDKVNRSGVETYVTKSENSTGLLKRSNTTWRNKFSSRDDTEVKKSWWTYVSRGLTCYIPACCLSSCKMKDKAIQQAWREKVALCLIILILMGFVGFFTFGFQAVVCDYKNNTVRYDTIVNVPNTSFVAIHGRAYDSWTLYNEFQGQHGSVAAFTPENMVGKDLSAMFPPVDGACNQILGTNDLPFPCTADGIDGAHCHRTTGSNAAGSPLTNENFQADLFIPFTEIPSNMVAYNGKVLDVSKWTTGQDFLGQDFYDDIMKHVGNDVTYIVGQVDGYKIRAECLSEVFAISKVDSSSFGCVLSQVFIWISFIIIMGLVGAKFLFALFFHFAIGWRLGKRESGSMVARDLARRHAEEETRQIMRRPTVSAENRASFSHSLSTDTLYNNGNSRDIAQNTETSVPLNKSSRYIDLELSAPYTHRDPSLNDPNLMHTMVMMPCYSEGLDSLRSTLDSIALTYYPATHKCIVAVADGIIKGSGEEKYTWEYLVDMMDIDDRFADEDPRKGGRPPAYSYVSIADGNKRKNFAEVYVGWYKFMEDKKGQKSEEKSEDKTPRGTNGELRRMRSMAGTVRKRKHGRVPMITIVKVGNDEEQANGIKSGNRGKRDSQALLMQFLTKIMFDDRMTELEFDIFHKLWTITGLHPGSYESVLMVDADTRVYPDSLTHLVACMKRDPTVMGVCGETQVYNKWQSWVTMIQVYEYYISHHLSKAFESVFGGVTCLPGCFCMYRIKAPRGDGEWVPILANPDIVEDYSENVVDTLHKKNLLLLGEDRYLTTLMLRTFPKRNNIFVPQAICKTVIPDSLWVLISQRRRWINSTIHNLMELALVRDLCGTFCFSMQFIISLELLGSVVLPAATFFTIYMIINSFTSSDPQILPLILLAAIILLPTLVSVLTIRRWIYFFWFFVYLLALPGWQVILPLYAFWHFDDFTWGDTRKVTGDDGKDHSRRNGEFDHSGINMKRWSEWVRFKAHESESFSEFMINAADTSANLGPNRFKLE